MRLDLYCKSIAGVFLLFFARRDGSIAGTNIPIVTHDGYDLICFGRLLS